MVFRSRDRGSEQMRRPLRLPGLRAPLIPKNNLEDRVVRPAALTATSAADDLHQRFTGAAGFEIAMKRNREREPASSTAKVRGRGDP